MNKNVCNMDCLHCKFDDCINDNAVQLFETKEKDTKQRTEKQVAIHRKYLRAKSKALQTGICMNCGKNHTAKGKVVCDECMQKKYDKEKENRKNGLCKCGKAVVDGKKHCADCLERAKDYSRRIRLYRKTNKLCIECGKPSETVTCDACVERRREWGRIRKNKKIKEAV